MSDDKKKPAAPPEPWERQASESDEAWLSFRAYRDMVPDERKITNAAAKSTATLSKWYRDHNWEERVRAHDAKFDKIRIEEREQIYRRKAREIAIDHMVMLSNARDLVARELNKFAEVSRETDAIGLVKVAELTKLFELVVKLDRLVRGETTENVGSTAIDYSALDPEELDKLNELLEKATKNADPEKAPSIAKTDDTDPDPEE